MSTGVAKESAEPLSETGRLNSQMLTLWLVEARNVAGRLLLGPQGSSSPAPSQSLCTMSQRAHNLQLTNCTWRPTGTDQQLCPPASIKHTHMQPQNTGGRDLEDEETMDLMLQLRHGINTHSDTWKYNSLSSRPGFIKRLLPISSWLSVTEECPRISFLAVYVLLQRTLRL